MTASHDLESQLLVRMSCPLCGGALLLSLPEVKRSGSRRGEGDTEARCLDCGASYARVEGIWRMLTKDEQQQYKPFLERYPALRRHEGREQDEAYFLAAPGLPPRDLDPRTHGIRLRSLRKLNELLAREQRQTSEDERWALDLGAGNGWLSRHLTHLGYRTVALDLVVAGLDSLAGVRLYIERDQIWIGRVQAPMSRPPFRDAAFALCTISAALHYADIEDTLRSVERVLKPSGLLVITDSPIYTSLEAGQLMVAERQAWIRSVVGLEAPEPSGGRNFLVERELLAVMSRTGFSIQTISIERPLGRLRRAAIKAFNPSRREQARFPVIVGRKR